MKLFETYIKSIIGEEYGIDPQYKEFTGDYENDVMFYADYNEGTMRSWVEQQTPIKTVNLAQGADLIEMNMGAEEGMVYIFERPADFTQMAFIVKEDINYER